jgi:hypothetical protein
VFATDNLRLSGLLIFNYPITRLLNYQVFFRRYPEPKHKAAASFQSLLARRRGICSAALKDHTNVARLKTRRPGSYHSVEGTKINSNPRHSSPATRDDVGQTFRSSPKANEPFQRRENEEEAPSSLPKAWGTHHARLSRGGVEAPSAVWAFVLANHFRTCHPERSATGPFPRRRS